MIDVIEILIHWYAGRSQNELAASLGVDRKTLRKYTAPAVAAGMAPGGPPMAEADWRAAGDRLVPAAGRSPAAAGVLAGDRAAPRLHRRPAQGGGDGRRRSISGCATSTAWTRRWPVVRRWVRANLPEEARRAQVTVLRDTPAARASRRRSTTAGWGCGSTRRSGRRRTVWAFVMVLSLLAAHVRAPDADRWTRPSGPRRTWRRSRSSAACPRGWSRTTSRPGWTGPTSTTRRSTGRMPSWPRTTARWSTRPGRSSPRTSRRSSGRCPMCGTRSGGAGSSPRSRQMRADAVAWCSEVAGRAGVSPAGRGGPGRGVRRGRGSRRCGRCRRRRSCWPPGRAREVGPDIHAKVGAHALLGAVALPRRPRRRPVHDHHGAVLPPRTADQDPSAQGPRASRPTCGDYPPEKIAFHMRTPTWCRTPRRRDRPGLRRR